MTNEFLDDAYEPTEEEKKEIEEVLAHKAGEEKKTSKTVKNRVFYNFNSEDHWRGWLKIHGIAW
jgi:hypothetical protein